MANEINSPTRKDLSRVLGETEYDLVSRFEELFRLARAITTWLIIEEDGNTISKGLVVKAQATPNAETAAITLTIAKLLVGITTGTHATGSNINYQLPTGTLTDAGVTFSDNDSFEWVLINLSAAAADTLTVTANTDHTIVGNAIIQSAHSTTGLLYGYSARFLTRKTATNTFITYRIG